MNLIVIGPTLQARSYSSYASVILIPGPGEVNHEKQHHRTHYRADHDGLRSIHGTYDRGPTNIRFYMIRRGEVWVA